MDRTLPSAGMARVPGSGHFEPPLENGRFGPFGTPNVQLPTPKGSGFAGRGSGSQLSGKAVAFCLGSSQWESKKPFDLRERLFEFGLLVIRVVQFLHTRGPIGVAVSYQILNAGMSAGSNYEEADDGSSTKDSVAKKKIALRELKECRWRMRLIRAAGILTPLQDPVITESDELVRILSTIIRKAERPDS
jgi:four helix bundle protein